MSTNSKEALKENDPLYFKSRKVKNLIKRSKYADRVGEKASVFLTAVLEFMSRELLIQAGSVTKSKLKKIIKPNHISLALKINEEMQNLLSNVTISEGASKFEMNK